MTKTLLFCVLFFLATFAQEQPPPPNSTVCFVGTSKCNGDEYNCVCQHGGICVGPAFVECGCQTPNVWNGTYCDQPLCVGPNFPSGGCVHGLCDTPGHCVCEVGYRGYDCSISLPCTNACTKTGDCACLNGGSCTDTNVCSCPPGFASDFCEIAVCDGGCGQGTCIRPNVCQCNPGYNGTRCEKAICDPPCKHGNCASPYTCDCFGTGYSHCPGDNLVCGCDEDECQRGERPCDQSVICANTIGNFTCAACPVGTVGTPYLEYPLSPANKTYYTGGCKPAPSDATTATTTQETIATTVVTTVGTTTVPATSAQATTATTANGATTATSANGATTATSANGATTATSVNGGTTATTAATTVQTTAITNNNGTSNRANTTTQATRTSDASVIVEEDESNAAFVSIAILLVVTLL